MDYNRYILFMDYNYMIFKTLHFRPAAYAMIVSMLPWIGIYV